MKVASLLWILVVALGPVMIDDVARVQREAERVAHAVSGVAELGPDASAPMPLPPEKRTRVAERAPASAEMKRR